MLDENTKKILSDKFSISEKEISEITDSVFDNISKILLKRKSFHIENIGTLSIEDMPNNYSDSDISNENKVIVFYPNEKTYYSLESLALSIALEFKQSEKSIKEIVKTVFSDIRECLETTKKCDIKNFGTFYLTDNIAFSPSTYLQYLINPSFNLVKDNVEYDNQNIENETSKILDIVNENNDVVKTRDADIDAINKAREEFMRTSDNNNAKKKKTTQNP